MTGTALVALTEHRPSDPALLAREARQLLGLGLSIPDAAQAIGMPAPALAQLLTDDKPIDFNT
jgi:hypothetical protein